MCRRRVRGHSSLARSGWGLAQNPGRRDEFCWRRKNQLCWLAGPPRRPVGVKRIPIGRKESKAQDYGLRLAMSCHTLLQSTIICLNYTNDILNYCQGKKGHLFTQQFYIRFNLSDSHFINYNYSGWLTWESCSNLFRATILPSSTAQHPWIFSPTGCKNVQVWLPDCKANGLQLERQTDRERLGKNNKGHRDQ